MLFALSKCKIEKFMELRCASKRSLSQNRNILKMSCLFVACERYLWTGLENKSNDCFRLDHYIVETTEPHRYNWCFSYYIDVQHD